MTAIEIEVPSTAWQTIGTYGGGLRTSALGGMFGPSIIDAVPLPDNPTPEDEVAYWARRLHSRLDTRRARLDILEHWFRGLPPDVVPPGASSTQTYELLEKVAKVGWARLIVEAPRRRMIVDGFRSTGDQGELIDAEAARLWRRNRMHRKAATVHRACLAFGEAYVIVGLDQEGGRGRSITVEDPRECITEADPVTGDTIAALKAWRDQVAGRDYGVLFLPGVAWRLERPATEGVGLHAWQGWQLVGSREVPGPIPVVPFLNEVDLGFGPGATAESEIEVVIPALRRVMLLVFERIVIAVHQAFRQRAAKGTYNEDDQGNPINWSDILRADPGAVWALPPGVDMWESAGVDLTPILESVKEDVIEIAAITSTPLYYLRPSPQNGSAEGAAVQREALVAKVEDKQLQTSDAWAQVIALATSTEPEAWEVLWRDANRFSLAERYDAASKASAAGVPWETVMSDVLQFTPEHIDRMRSQRAGDAFLTAIGGPDTDLADLPAGPPAAR